MKKNQGLKLRQLNEKLYVLDIVKGQMHPGFDRLVTFNSSMAYLWQNVADDDITVDKLVNLLINKYDVDVDVAKRDSEEIIRQWHAAGLIY